MDNFNLKTNSEVNLINYSPSSGLARGVTIQGKLFNEIPADALVVCTGAHTARFLNQTLGVFAPIVPIRGYTFDVPTTTPFIDTHLMFHKSALQAVQLTDGMWKMTAFGDIAGLSFDLDQRRVRTAKNTVCITLDKKEGLLSKNIQAVLRACSPDDLPVIGPLKTHPNIYINSGHGPRNAAFSIGSSKLVADLLSGTNDSASKDIDTADFSPLRLQM